MSDEPVTESTHSDGVQTWGGLQILEEVGSGGFGRVYRAWEPTLARDVALKIIRPREPRPDALDAILREGQLLARIRHTNVVTIYGAQRIGDEVGLWMEFVRGRSLAQLIKDDGPRAAEEAAVIGVSVCQALAAVHHAGVLHRDVKAHNVMREEGGRIVLMDFGAGQMLDETRRSGEGLVGTLPYMAPEVLGGGHASPRSDIYSAGVLLYYLVSGGYPVEGRRSTDFLLAHARSERRPLSDIRPDIPAAFVRIVERATSLRPDDRYATPGAMLRDLTALVAGDQPTRTDVQPTPAVPPSPAKRWSWRIPAAIAAAAAAIWALGAITSIVFNHTLSRPLAFSGESVFSWWSWGYKPLVAPAVKVTIVVLLWKVLRAVARVVTHAVRPAADLSAAIRSRRHALGVRLGFDDAETAANALLAVQILAVALFCWYFRDILSGVMTFIETAPPSDLEAMHPAHYLRHQYYDATLGLLILGMVLGIRHLHRMRQRFGGAVRSSLSSSYVVLALAFILLALPYRLLWHSEFERVTWGSHACYLLGERKTGESGPSVLVYCPDVSVPRVRDIPLPDVTFRRGGLVERLYCLGAQPCEE